MITITSALFGAAALSAILAIAADWEERRHRAFYLLKPLTTALILGAALSRTPVSGVAYQQFVAGALLLSMLGDICLMFPGNAWFTAGLSSFLLAHVGFILAYVKGFTLQFPPVWTVLPVLYGLGLSSWLLPRAGSLKPAVAVYCVVLLGMTLAAAIRLQVLGGPTGLFAVAGSLLFVVSDSALAIRQFGGGYRGAQALILSTYWASIALIAASV